MSRESFHATQARPAVVLIINPSFVQLTLHMLLFRHVVSAADELFCNFLLTPFDAFRRFRRMLIILLTICRQSACAFLQGHKVSRRARAVYQSPVTNRPIAIKPTEIDDTLIRRRFARTHEGSIWQQSNTQLPTAHRPIDSSIRAGRPIASERTSRLIDYPTGGPTAYPSKELAGDKNADDSCRTVILIMRRDVFREWRSNFCAAAFSRGRLSFGMWTLFVLNPAASRPYQLSFAGCRVCPRTIRTQRTNEPNPIDQKID